jgi:alcohol dehydrogenase class IV
MPTYELSIPARILLGHGASADLPAIGATTGQRALLVTSAGALARGGPVAACIEALQRAGVVAAHAYARGEPEADAVEQAGALARAERCDYVIAIGGGSVIDTAKAAAALATNPGGALEYMEAVGAARSLATPALPLIAVPTTAGAGSEATRNAVIRSAAHATKASIRDGSMLPRVALVDPDLLAGLPPEVVATCGMDALTQLIEAFTGRRASPLTDGLCREGIALIGGAIRRAVDAPDDTARFAMASAALLSGMALANAGLGAVHAIAGPLGGATAAAHGAVCAALLAPISAANIAALQREAAPALARYAEVAALLGFAGGAGSLPAHLSQLADQLQLPRLTALGLTEPDIQMIAERAAATSNARNNPAALGVQDLADAMRAAL